MKSNPRWQYDQPFDADCKQNYKRILSQDTMIREAKERAAIDGHIYEDDEQALLDFIAVHWCYPYPNVGVKVCTQ